MKKFKEQISLLVAKDPKKMILLAILGFNIVFLLVSACVISFFAPSTVHNHGFWASVFYTITMILDAGCIQFVVEDVGQTGVGIIIACLLIVLIGMVTFTGAVIGYFTNYISEFINTANAGTKKLIVHDHIVILNWNTRAVEIINDLLYTNSKEKVIVLAADNREKIAKEIAGRLSGTLQQENDACKKIARQKPGIRRYVYYNRHKLNNKLTIIVRQGDTYSTKDLSDISVDKAKTIIILGRDVNSSVCKYNSTALLESREKGDPFTVKVLAQVAELTSNEQSADEQKIVVESEDDWTLALIQKIVEQKENLQKCNIVPISVNRTLGQLLSQFSIMPELNMVYSELFSNKGATIYSCELNQEDKTEQELIQRTLAQNKRIVPLTKMYTRTGTYGYYIANSPEDLSHKDTMSIDTTPELPIQLQEYKMLRKNVIVFGHNSNSLSIMEGFRSFCNEWGTEALNILVIDSAASLEKLNNYRDFPYVRETVVADIYDKEIIYQSINTFVDSNQNDTSILILSDDRVTAEDIDSNAITALIYMCDILDAKIAKNPTYDVGQMDIIVEILNPKHYDIINRYGKNNIVISNRYISKMVTQIGTKESIYDFYKDILEYDTQSDHGFSSKEIYIKEADRFFKTLPPACTAAELVRGVYAAGKDDNKSILLGYIDCNGHQTIFTGKQSNQQVQLTEKDKLIVFSNH